MDLQNTDTIAALATAPGKSGICVVRVSGPDASRIAEQILGFAPKPRIAHFTAFLNSTGETLDKGIALFFSNPASFTGEDVLELQGHGGPVIQKLILDRTLELGARLANPGEFSERAFLNNKIDLAQAEAIADLIDASSVQAAKSAMRTLNGEFSNKVNAFLHELTKTRVNVEAAIDFSDEDIDIISDTGVSASLRSLSEKIQTALDQANQGALLKEGMQIVIAGKPNAGKSSLLNALSGTESAIVTSIAGTTRDLLSEKIQIDGMPVHITDTAGLRTSDDVVEQEGIRRAADAMRACDKILLLIDASQIAIDHPQDAEISLNEAILPDLITVEPELLDKTLVILNKADLVKDLIPGSTTSILRIGDARRDIETIIISAKEQLGLDLLSEALKRSIGFNTLIEGVFTARERHLIALKSAAALIDSAQQGIATNLPFELIAEDLRLAQRELSKITGEFSSDDLLGEIFSNFCVGK